MPDLWFDVDISLSEVPVNAFPLTDDTDFKSRETGIAAGSSGMDLVWNFLTTTGGYTQTAVTPTTAGDYDWAHQGDGMYSIEIPSSGGASINNSAAGFGWFTGVVNGVLPWKGPTIGFRAAALNDALIDGGDLLDVNLIQVEGDTTTLGNLADAYDGTGYDLGGIDVSELNTAVDAIGSDGTGLTEAGGDGDHLNEAGGTGDHLTAVPWNSNWDAEVQSEVDDAIKALNLDHLILNAGTCQGAISSTFVLDTNSFADDEIRGMLIVIYAGTGAGQARPVSGFTASSDTAVVSDNWETTPSTDSEYILIPGPVYVSEMRTNSINANTLQTGAIDASNIAANAIGASELAAAAVTEIAAGVWNALQSSYTSTGSFGEIATEIASILADTSEVQADLADGGRLDLIFDAILADTDELQSDDIPGTLAALNDVSTTDINDQVIDVLRTDTLPDSYATDGSQPTFAQAILAIKQFLEERSVSGTTVTVKKPDGSTTAMTFTLDDGDNPTSITRSG